MLDNFYDTETEEEEEQRLILKAHELSLEAHTIIADAERELVILRPLVDENEGFALYWSEEVQKAQSKRDADRETHCRAALSECQQAISKIRSRIVQLEEVKARMSESLMFIKVRGTHA